MIVLDQCQWRVHRNTADQGVGGLDGKLTKCSLDGVVFYVRESLKHAGGSFMMTSGERLSWKQGTPTAGSSKQVLELCCPTAAWERIAAVVAEADQLGRPVMRNRLFTAEWAEEQLRRAKCQ